MFKGNKKILLVFCFIIAFFTVAHFALALDTGIEYGAGTGLSNTQDIRITIAKIIRIALGFLGIVAVCLIIYAGWLWMTAGGEADKVERAKKILTEAVIGLIIILSAFAIASFILNALIGATTDNGGDGSGCNPPCYSIDQHCCASVCVSRSVSCGDFNPRGGSFTASIYPSGEWSVPLNGTGWVRFNDQIKPDVGDFKVNSIDKPNGTIGDLITYQISISTIPDSKIINYQPVATCDEVKAAFPAAGIVIPVGYGDNKCFRPDTVKDDLYGGGSGYRVQVDNYKAIGGTSLTCFGNACVTDFSASPTLDVTPPTISFDYRTMCVNTNNTLAAWVNDDWGVKEVGFYVDNKSNTPSSTSTPPTLTRNYYAEISSTLITTPGNHTIKVVALDIADNYATVEKTIKAWPSHCCNGARDVDETEVDCGGSCAACDGSRCDKVSAPTSPATCDNNLCASQFCTAQTSDLASCAAAGYAAGVANCCICRRQPVITGIFPVGGFCEDDLIPDTQDVVLSAETNIYVARSTLNNSRPCLLDSDCISPIKCNKNRPSGAVGNFVTIVGKDFDVQPGKVYFRGDKGGLLEAKLANDSILGNSQCADSWSDTQIIAIVPDGASQGSVKVETRAGFSDDSRANPALLDFIVNRISRPGLCKLENAGITCPALNPNCEKAHGLLNDTINYYGIKLSDSQANFGDLSNKVVGVTEGNFNDKDGKVKVPNIQAGRTTSFVMKGNIYSNYLIFNKDQEPYTGPRIISFEPSAGKVGQYVTIQGSGFGKIRGASKVYFEVEANEANYQFPAVCADSVWSDNQVIVKVPAGLNDIGYTIKMQIGTYTVDTSKLTPSQFTVDSKLDLTPSLCKIKPIRGQVDSTVDLYGEYFGDKSSALIRFQTNKDQSGDNISFGVENKASKATTKVPVGAISGVVKIIQNGKVCAGNADCANNEKCVNAKCQRQSNPLNFSVGICLKNDECGSGSLCCSVGTPYASQCKDITGGKTEQDVCFPEIKSCVYEWNFSTLSASQCLSTQTQCGRSCCKPSDSCDENYNYGTGKCDNIICPIGEVTCENKCCKICENGVCVPDEGDPCYNGITAGGSCDIKKSQCGASLTCDLNDCICKKPCNINTAGTTTCTADQTKCLNRLMPNCNTNTCLCESNKIESCSGYGNQCANAGFCPNSYGQCSTNPGNKIVTGNCDFSCLDSLPAYCQDGGCSYISSLNKCKSSQPCVRIFPDVNKNNVTAQCVNNKWQIETSSSCPTDWINLGAGKCAGPNCAPCLSGSSCGSDGFCLIDQPVCLAGSTCGSDNKCAKAGDTAGCECCCRKTGTDVNQDCCVPLKCQGTCGSDTTDDNEGFGLCTGCAKISGDQLARNNACNCTGSSGKYCDNSDNVNGVCKDCAQLSTAGSCTDKGIGTCCVDAMKGNVCSGGTGVYGIGQGVPDYRYCSYYKCNAGNDGCNTVKPVASSTVAVYPDTTQCNAACVYTQPPQFGQNCASYVAAVTPQSICDVNKCGGFSCLNADGYGASKAGSYTPSVADNTCGICCCDPAHDTCVKPLTCQADRGTCSGAGRGLCCGCSKDSECGNDATGCGSDACCQSRPNVIPPIAPTDGETGVCRNVSISATFDQLMQINTFVGNVIVAGEYGLSPCPAGTQYLTAVYKSTMLAKINSWLAKLPLVNRLFFSEARADAPAAGNYCAVAGSASGYNIQGNKTVLEFKLQKLLAPAKKYYVIIKGDSDITDAINNGVLSQAGIGMKGLGLLNAEKKYENPVVFNGVAFNNAKIWSFTTRNDSDANKGICEIASVEIDPLSYLFQTNVDNTSDNDATKATFNTINDSDLVYRAIARAADGTALNSLASVYSWTWSWVSGSIGVFTFVSPTSPSTLADNEKLLRAKSNVTAGESLITATATITKNGSAPYDKKAEANAYLMVCANPWPAVVTSHLDSNMIGTWKPWQEPAVCAPRTGDCSPTNFELYYCRDAGASGTADDLPAIFSDSAVIRGTSLRCSDGKGSCGSGSVVDGNCTYTTGTTGSGKCQVDILKELYFFREGLPATSGSFTVTALAKGGAVLVGWTQVTSPADESQVAGYKIYYGTAKGSYGVPFDVKNAAATSQEISGLTNGRPYYFALTSYNAQKAESALSVFRDADVIPPDSVTPRDILGPQLKLNQSAGIPEATPKDRRVELNWDNNYSDAVSFRAFYKADDDCIPTASFGSSVSGINNKATVSGLANGVKYCFGVVAYDLYGNPSATTTVQATLVAPAN